MKVLIALVIVMALVIVILFTQWFVQYAATKNYCPLKSCDGITIESIGR